MDDLLKNIYSPDSPATPDPSLFNHSGDGGRGGRPWDVGGSKTTGEVRIVEGGRGGERWVERGFERALDSDGGGGTAVWVWAAAALVTRQQWPKWI
ncbi:hypothetical protein NL676_038344 [Syzygium grande]|nr:hypothetical protein NL676_038344 [Syzygium grande]